MTDRSVREKQKLESLKERESETESEVVERILAF